MDASHSSAAARLFDISDTSTHAQNTSLYMATNRSIDDWQ
jgi:hypothetical protein